MRKVLAAILLLLVVSVPAMSASEVIVDNGSATLVGTWSTGTASNDYGTNYRYCSITTAAGNTATYTPNLPVTAGDWQVYVWYPSGLSSTTKSVKVTIHHAWGDTIFYPDQTYNYGVWYYIGTFRMTSGTGNNVQIRNAGPTGYNAIADAVRFYSPSGGVDSTAPTISSVSAFPWYDGVAVSWTTNEAATSQVEYGPTNTYGTSTTEDLNMVTSHTVHITGLPGNTLRHFRVKGKDGMSNSSQSGDYTWTTAAAPVPEWRAAWADSWGNGFLNADQVTTYVDECYNANYNVIIPEIRKAGDAYYDSAYEPYSNDPDIGEFDALADLVAKAHAKGTWPDGTWRMEVHPWIVTYRIWRTAWPAPPADHVWALHPEWAMKNSAGSIVDGASYDLDPGVPGVQDYISKVVIDIITKYDVDGFNYDYIRYPANNWGYNDITEQRFLDEYKYAPPTSSSDPHWGTWCDYRRQQVTDLIKKCYLEIMWRKPHINMNVDSIGWLGGDPNIDFTGTRQYYDVLQNSKAWMEQHIIDTNLCMNYNREHNPAQQNNYRLWSNWLATMQTTTGRIGASGPGVYLNSIPAAVTQKTYSRTVGCGGLGSYSYQVTNKDNLPFSDFANALTTTIFNSAVPVPDMPWKSAPTTGIIFGTVTNATKPNGPIYQDWIYKATVQVTGPVTRSTQTDATGTYGFMDLPPGTYTVTCSKSEFTTRTYTTQTILAGDVLRDDFDICPSGQVSISSPSSTVPKAGVALISLAYEPIDPDPVTVMGSIPIDGRLSRWDRPGQGTVSYDENDQDYFGDFSLDQGYWLMTNAAQTITYQAYPGYPGMRTQSLPKAGWSIIGCPFPVEKKWADMRVTNGSATVSLEQARTNGWINSVGLWWDSQGQGTRDIGLPDDACYTDYLQPWHGTWFRSFADNLTLTQR